VGRRRHGLPDQRLTIEESIEACTKAPAWASVEDDSGTLQPVFMSVTVVY
jgi:hypothetical protein